MTAMRTPLNTPLTPRPHASGTGPVSIEAVRALLVGLDRNQRRAVTHRDGPLLVIAGPGTGKTEVITRRVAWLVASRRARPSEILALTFTERAADEMHARVDVLVPYGQADTAIHTFHAFGDWVLREHALTVGRSDIPRVIGGTEAAVLLRDHLFSLGLERLLPLGDPTRFVGALVDLFARAKDDGIGPEDLAAYAAELEAGVQAAQGTAPPASLATLEALRDEAGLQAEIGRAFAAYEALLRDRSLIDHADQIRGAVRLLEDRPSVRLALRRRFRYVVVDESQDADPQQLALVASLVGPEGNVTFVGDDDQAIYAFRGAVGQGLAGLADTYPDLRDIVLNRNYRSRKPVLDAARRLIRHNDPHRLEVQRGVDKTLTAVRRARRPALVRHHAYATSGEEADAVAREIQAKLAAGVRPGSIAVLVRTNADATPVLASLDVRGIPRRFSGASGLFSHREVRDVLSLMSVLVTPGASEDLYAVLAAPATGIAAEALTALCEMASRRRRSLWSVAFEVVEQPGILRLATDDRSRLASTVAHLRDSMATAHEQASPIVLYQYLRESGWLADLVAAAERGDDGPLRRVARLFEIVRAQSELLTDPRLAVVVPVLRSLVDAGHDPAAPSDDDPRDAVAVLTVHQSKGLEFATVFVVGLTEGRFPIQARREPLALPPSLTGRPADDDPEAHRAEERRLFYVAMTRARDELILSHAARGREGGRRRRPSLFLAEALGHEVDDVAETDAVASLVEAPPTISHPAEATAAGAPDEGPLTLSFTQIDDYLTCPRKYHLRHVARVPTAPHHAIVLGNALHQALAVANEASRRGNAVSQEDLHETLRAHWSSEGFLSAEHEAARFAAGEAALTRFLARSATEPEATIIAVEQPFSVRLGQDRVRGRYDAVRSVDGKTVITDYKSGDVRDPTRARERARGALQLQLYAMAWEAEHGAWPDAVELHFLEGDVVGRVTPTERQLQQARQKLATAAQGIRSGAFDATPGYPACAWCPFQRICPSAA
jgi:DNA helicase-2/ATP-dependent DNA helicase PcrA